MNHGSQVFAAVVASALSLCSRAHAQDLSDATGHHGGAVPGRRLDRQHRPHPRRRHARTRSDRPSSSRMSAARPAISASAGSRGRRRTATTLCSGSWPTHVLNAAIFTLPYDVQTGFRAGRTGRRAAALRGRHARRFPPNNLTELIAWLKANPGQATQGTVGLGGASHIAGVFFQTRQRNQFRWCRIAAPVPPCRT